MTPYDSQFGVMFGDISRVLMLHVIEVLYHEIAFKTKRNYLSPRLLAEQERHLTSA